LTESKGFALAIPSEMFRAGAVLQSGRKLEENFPKVVLSDTVEGVRARIGGCIEKKSWDSREAVQNQKLRRNGK